jgi:hypothetical protein
LASHGPKGCETEYDSAFSDIAETLIARFGGHVIERTVDDPL